MSMCALLLTEAAWWAPNLAPSPPSAKAPFPSCCWRRASCSLLSLFIEFATECGGDNGGYDGDNGNFRTCWSFGSSAKIIKTYEAIRRHEARLFTPGGPDDILCMWLPLSKIRELIASVRTSHIKVIAEACEMAKLVIRGASVPSRIGGECGREIERAVQAGAQLVNVRP